MSHGELHDSIAAELAKRFQLRQISCVGLEAKPVAGDVPPNAELTWDLPKTRLVWELEGNLLRVVAPMSVFIEALPKAPARDKLRLADISVAMRIEYAVDGKRSVDEEKVPHYVGICSFLHLWPYFRADVQWLSTKLGFPPLLLPVIVSGHAAKQVLVSRLRDVQAEPPMLASKPSKARKPVARKRA